MRGLSPQRVIETSEDLARVGVPAPPEIVGELFEAFDAVRQRDQCNSSPQAPTSDANFDRSILPPDTMATMRPRARPVSAAATAQAAAPSVMTRHRWATSFIADATSASGTTIEPATSSLSRGHIVRS